MVKGEVLLVDDEPNVLMTLQAILEREGYAIATASSGSDALELLRERQFDVVLSDLRLDEVDGHAILREVRRTSPETATIIVTGYGTLDDALQAIHAGAHDFLLKPTEPEQLLTVVGRGVERRHLARQVQAQLVHYLGENERLYRAAREAEERARQQAARVDALFRQAPAIIAVFRGPEHVFELANRLYLDVVGREEQALIGKSIRDALPELEGQGYFELLDRVFATGQPYVGTELPARLDRTGDGKLDEAVFNFVYQPYRMADGAVEGILIHAVEVTEQVRARQRAEALAAENARLYDEAQAALHVRDEFLASATHDLKIPLTAIAVQAQVLQRRIGRGTPSDLPRIEPGLAQIGAAASRMARLINELLDLAQLQAGRALELERRPTDLAALVRRVVSEDLPAAAAKRVRVRGPRPTVVGEWDAFRLERVVANLLANAVKYSPAGGVITVTVTSEDTWAVLSVEDRGLGIPGADLPRVFDEFHRGANTVGALPGRGIGLAGARRIVEQHGGSISAESQEGVGTTFTVRLPIEVV